MLKILFTLSILLISLFSHAGHFVEDGGAGASKSSMRDFVRQTKPLGVDEIPGMKKLLDLVEDISMSNYARVFLLKQVFPSRFQPYFRLSEEAMKGPAKELIKAAIDQDRGDSKLHAVNMEVYGLSGILLLPSFYSETSEDAQTADLFAATIRGPPSYTYDQTRFIVLSYLENPKDPEAYFRFFRVVVGYTNPVGFLRAAERFDREQGLNEKKYFEEFFGARLSKCILAGGYDSYGRKSCTMIVFETPISDTQPLLARAFLTAFSRLDFKIDLSANEFTDEELEQIYFQVKKPTDDDFGSFTVEVFKGDKSLGFISFF